MDPEAASSTGNGRDVAHPANTADGGESSNIVQYGSVKVDRSGLFQLGKNPINGCEVIDDPTNPDAAEGQGEEET